MTDRVDQALESGFSHVGKSVHYYPSLFLENDSLLDTAQSYRNETEAGQAIHESGLKREDIFITTKFSGFKPVEESIQDSLKNVRKPS